MTESADEEQILNLAASSAPSLGPWQVVGFAFVEDGIGDGERWRAGDVFGRRQPIPGAVAQALGGLSGAGGGFRCRQRAGRMRIRCAASPGHSGS